MTRSGGTSTPLRVYLFGQFRIEREKETIRLPTRQIRSLLAFLLLHPGAHSREKLAARFWPDVPDASARASLRNALSTLRRKLGRELLQANRETAQINSDYPLWVDAVAFQTQATRFLDGPSPDPNVVNLAHYTGDLLADFYDDWVLVERENLRALYLETALALTQQMRSQSKYEKAIEFAVMALARDRANERAHQHLMFCHVALGNRSAALKQYEACRLALREELAVDPSPATKKLHEWIQQAPAERLPVEAAITNLPIPLTTFIGRRREIAAVKELLASARLLTLTGAGGSGKTRLAIRVATDLLDAYGDGVWWVELAEVADAELAPGAAARATANAVAGATARAVARATAGAVAGTTAKALGAPEVPTQSPSDTLVNFLRSKKLLLVLDNCEHLVTGCALLVKRLLGACPQLDVLATSRETLGVAGEQVWPVPTLSVPEPHPSLPVDDLLQYEAVRLFVGRATAVNPDFALTEANAPPVAEICRRLEGLPLAIELAAARANVLTVEQIASRLDDAFHLLADGRRTALPRHQTLRAAIDWSYELLSEKERALFRRLSAFAGGWTLPAAEAICAGEGIEEEEIFNTLSRLVDKSLVQAQQRGEEARFRMLQTIQQYSHERLLEAGESDAVRERHLHYFLQRVKAVNSHMGYMLADAEMELWLGRLEAEVDNLRAAVRWSARGGRAAAPPAAAGRGNTVEAGLRLAGLLHWFWFARGRFSEGRAWLTRLLDMDEEVATPARAQALLTAGYLDCWQGNFAAGRSPLAEALALYQRLEDGHGIAFALHGLGFVALGGGNLALAGSRFEASLREARALNDKWISSFALHFLAIVLTYQGEFDAASSNFEEGDALIEQMGGPRQGLAFSQFHLGRIARLRGDYATARSRHAQGMQLFQETGDRRGVGYSLAGFAVLAAAQGEMQRAARLSGAVASLEAVIGSFLEMPLQIEYDQVLSNVREALGEEAFAAAAAEGRTMTLEQAIAYALK